MLVCTELKTIKKDESYFGSGKALKRAILKYGIENFSNKILVWCETEELLADRERFWITKLNAQTNGVGYNMKDGGIGWFNIDVSGANNPMFGVHRYGSDNPNYGNHRTDESKLRQSESIAKSGGRHGSKNPMYGKSHSLESRAKMSVNHTTSKPLLGKIGKDYPAFGLKWWCDGVNPPIKSKTSPGAQYHRGRK